MSETIRKNQHSILILADFADGSWHATSFAMQFLYMGKSPISILQTYKSPGWGPFIIRKLSHHLKKNKKQKKKKKKKKIIKISKQ